MDEKNWDYCYYAVNKKNKLIYGFDDLDEAKLYSKKNNFRVIAKNTLKKMYIDPSDYKFWSDEYPEFNEKEFVSA